MVVSIIAGNPNGLGNRVKCIASALLLGKRTQRPVGVYWPITRWCGGAFKELFCPTLPEVKRPNPNAPPFVLNRWRFLRERSWPSLDEAFGEIPDTCRREYLDCFQRLEPTEYVRQQVADFSERIGSLPAMAIRSWVDSIPRAELYFRIENIYKIVESHPRIFVTCDSAEVLDLLVSRYDKRVLIYPKRSHQVDYVTASGVQDALIEMYLLSKASKLYLSFGSTFGEVAWWLGGGKASVSYIEDIELRKNRPWDSDRSEWDFLETWIGAI